MRRKPRAKRPIEKEIPEGYDSKWEAKLHKSLLKKWDIHTEKLSYTIEHSYTPDFIKIINGKKIYLEAKGRFWDHAEYSKYIWIQKSLPEDSELVFIFASPFAPMPHTRRRKNGTKFSHAEWADKNNIRWYSEKNFPEEWKDEK